MRGSAGIVPLAAQPREQRPARDRVGRGGAFEERGRPHDAVGRAAEDACKLTDRARSPGREDRRCVGEAPPGLDARRDDVGIEHREGGRDHVRRDLAHERAPAREVGDRVGERDAAGVAAARARSRGPRTRRGTRERSRPGRCRARAARRGRRARRERVASSITQGHRRGSCATRRPRPRGGRYPEPRRKGVGAWSRTSDTGSTASRGTGRRAGSAR